MKEIIEEMLKNVVGLKQEVNEKQLLADVIDLLNECGLNDITKLSRSFEVITFFLNKNFNDKEFIKSIIRTCHGNGFVSNELTTCNIFLISRHLESCGWKEDDIRMAFANVQFGQISVSTFQQLDMIAVNERFRIGWHQVRRNENNCECHPRKVQRRRSEWILWKGRTNRMRVNGR